MYGTCETLCRELAAQYTENTPLMLVVWSPEEIQALADGMEISLTGHEIRTVLDHGLVVPEYITRRQAMVDQARSLLKNNTHEND